MTVKIRPYHKGGWEIDIMFLLDNGQRYRERRKAPVASKSAALRWGRSASGTCSRMAPMAMHRRRGPRPPDPKPTPEPVKKKEVPTFAAFAPRFIEGHVKANRHKPSTQEGVEKNLRAHILPAFGKRRLDKLSQEDLQLFKGQRAHLANKTVNNILSHLRTMLTSAVEWGCSNGCRSRSSGSRYSSPR